MKSLLFLACCLMGFHPRTAPYGEAAKKAPDFLDPTGTYILKGTIERNRIMGHSGEIRVKLLDPGQVAMSFYINKGYPGYESGAFTDTLVYNNLNQALYSPPGDRACTIYFCFQPYKAETMQFYKDSCTGCGFGKDVLAAAIFKKLSSEPPVIQDLSGRDRTP